MIDKGEATRLHNVVANAATGYNVQKRANKETRGGGGVKKYTNNRRGVCVTVCVRERVEVGVCGTYYQIIYIVTSVDFLSK